MKTVVNNTIVEIFVVVVIMFNTLLLVIFNPNKKITAETKATLESVDLCFTLFY
eukprot:SAG11_NODE_32276_length_285_cov_0.489247_1_plen_53_part_10